MIKISYSTCSANQLTGSCVCLAWHGTDIIQTSRNIIHNQSLLEKHGSYVTILLHALSFSEKIHRKVFVSEEKVFQL